jgi:hypothetical protein
MVLNGLDGAIKSQLVSRPGTSVKSAETSRIKFKSLFEVQYPDYYVWTAEFLRADIDAG